MSGPIERFPRFVDAVHQRLEAGAAEYGDRSFAQRADATAAELSEEALDLAGWGFVLWVRIEKIATRLAELEGQLVELELLVGGDAEGEGE